MKLGRNEPCWCGSGKKYKHCHMRRAEQSPVSIYDGIKRLRKSFTKKYCLCPEILKNECSRKIVRAHTVPKQGSLRKIAKNGSVYHIHPDPVATIKYGKKFEPSLIGISRATTFTGFCGYHDQTLFSPIENDKFNNTQEHCFLLFYRALCFELFQKRSFKWLIDNMRDFDSGKSEEDQMMIQEFISDLDLGICTGLRDLEKEKSILDNLLMNKEYDNIKYYILYFEKPLDIMCCGNVYPEVDFNGNQLIDLSEVNIEYNSFSISSFSSDENGIVAIVWLEDNENIIEKFIGTLHKQKNDVISHSILRFMFEFVGNIILNPTWWDELDSSIKSNLIQRANSGVSFTDERNSLCLLDDGLRIVNWRVVDRKYNVAI